MVCYIYTRCIHSHICLQLKFPLASARAFSAKCQKRHFRLFVYSAVKDDVGKEEREGKAEEERTVSPDPDL